ncbi:MAG: TRAP transporter large permease [Clostridiales Family XIII bacterium]|nr:TRAP transporter large permease [Clostridiales Family XIII bacterium]
MSSFYLLLAILFLLASLSVPIGVSLGISTLVTLVTTTTIPTSMISQNVFSGLNSFALMAIPFFMLAGNLMALGGIARRIVRLADVVLGRITGGLGIVTTAACMFFAALSGSGPATVSAIGSMMIPEMEKRGYDKGFSTGLTACAGTIGVIIPPSIPFVIYGVVASVSIGDLFIAGIIPGILIGLFLMIVCFVISKKRGYGKVAAPLEEGEKHQGCFKVFLDTIWALLAPLIILGGIYAGVFTPTEASVVAIVYSFIIGKFVYKELTFKIILQSLRSTADLNGLTGLALGFSMAFSAYLAMKQLPRTISTFMLDTFSSQVVMFLIILGVLLILGCFIDNISSCLIMTPVFLPIVQSYGMDPVHFGIAMTVALAIGFVTPPYGANLFIASAITGERVERIAKSALPFLIAMFVALLLIMFVPQISMGLVQLMRAAR